MLRHCAVLAVVILVAIPMVRVFQMQSLVVPKLPQENIDAILGLNLLIPQNASFGIGSTNNNSQARQLDQAPRNGSDDDTTRNSPNQQQQQQQQQQATEIATTKKTLLTGSKPGKPYIILVSRITVLLDWRRIIVWSHALSALPHAFLVSASKTLLALSPLHVNSTMDLPRLEQQHYKMK